MNAKQLIDTCDVYDFDPKQFRKEMNISWLVQYAIKQFKEHGI